MLENTFRQIFNKTSKPHKLLKVWLVTLCTYPVISLNESLAFMIGEKNLFPEKSDLVRGNRTVRSDVFAAVRFASGLPFRAAAPRALFLMPCTKCDASRSEVRIESLYKINNTKKSCLSCEIYIQILYNFDIKAVPLILYSYIVPDITYRVRAGNPLPLGLF